MKNEADMAEVEAAVAKEQTESWGDTLGKQARQITEQIVNKVVRREFRDACAIAAMQGMLAHGDDNSYPENALYAFKYAAEMLAERDRRDAEEDAKEKQK